MASEAEENRSETQKEIHNHCFTYPQGQVSIVPQLLTLMAAVASLLPWPWFGFSVDFLCIEYTVSGSSSYECAPLYLNQEDYWSTSSAQGWAAAIQTAAVFAIFATALGFVAFSLLVTATCFELAARKILIIVIMQGIAAFLSILTLIAGAANVSLTVTLLWYLQLRRGGATPKEETRSLVERPPHPETVTTVFTPNGEQRVEREYIDETGHVVKEVRISRSEQPHHSVEREPYPTSVTISTPTDDQFVEREYVDETGQGQSYDQHQHRHHHRHNHRHPQPAQQESL